MKVTFLGDSIRQQYVLKTAQLLGPDFDVWHPADNCRFSKYTLRGLFEWASQMQGSEIIHWNNGLWDICDLWGDGVFTSEAEYVENMLRILDILQKNHKVIIFATTTPVRNENRYDRNADIDRFNRIIVPLLQEWGVMINDLNALVKQDLYRYISEDTIHLSKEGIALCAGQVAECIRQAAKQITVSGASQKSAPAKGGLGAPVLL